MDRMPAAPHPPSDFGEPARRLWSATLKALRDQGSWQHSDRGALERYVRAMLRAADARAVAERDGLIAAGGRGQPIAHPALRIARDAERDAAEYARDLLLTPRARRLAGISETTALDDELAALLER
jgi:P27 family predicted phage terminase small subunit